jgi:threonylcarbamoyladenosine tRNA methylthiotransferase MtaB
MAVTVLTFGCRLNTVESEVMKREAEAAGVRHAVLVNTCAVTAEAVRKAEQAIRRARRDDPAVRIIVSGCAAETDPARFAGMGEVDLVLGNGEKLRATGYRNIPAFGVAAADKLRSGDIMAETETAVFGVDGRAGEARAFVAVQTGCDHRCTFCIIPYGRGPSRSVPMGAAVDEVRRIAQKGYPEIVLTGVDLTAYGHDLPGRPSLGRLVRAILKHVPELKRLRLSSIDSIEADDTLVAAFAEEERLMPHLHLSLQAGDDLILKRMKRRHLRGDAIRFTERLRKLRSDMVFGADIIAGFPTETEAMFENSLKIVEDCGLTHLHVFPFSARPGTPAARMPQLPGAVVKDRAARLREAGGQALQRHFAGEEGRVRQVLVEQPGLGRTEGYTPVEIDHGARGEIVPARITGRTERALVAEAMRVAARTAA